MYCAPTDDFLLPTIHITGRDPNYLCIPPTWKRVKAPGLPHPDDTYEISDECSEESPDRSNKNVPTWCADWVKLVQDQEKIDPDTVFGGNMPFVDLADVFPDSKIAADLKAGRLSADVDPNKRWQRDKLRKEEVANYRAAMGQTQNMDHLWRKPGDRGYAVTK